MTDAFDPASATARWLTFRVEDDQVRLVAQERLTMAVLPSGELGQHEARSGFWHEVQDSAGRPLYRRVTNNPLSTGAEILTDDPEQPVAYEQVARVARTAGPRLVAPWSPPPPPRSSSFLTRRRRPRAAWNIRTPAGRWR